MAYNLVRKLEERTKREFKHSHFDNMFEATRHLEDIEVQLDFVAYIKKNSIKGVRDKTINAQERDNFYQLYKRCLLFEAPHIFESYIIYMEIDRPYEKKFYMPRSKVLHILVKHYQDVADGVIKFLGISLPPRTGKSTLGIFYMTWQMGRFPDKPSIMSGHSSPLTQGFYDEAISLITNHEYKWGEIFPNHKFYSNAKYTTIDIGKKRRFSTLTCRAIEATLTGATEADNCLYTDDLVRDLEEAINPDRMQAKYDAYINQLKDRMTDQAHQVMVGTRWGIDDPLGRLAEEYADDPEYRFVVIPALDENGESNFDYEVKGFSTQYYEDMKRSVDAATFMAKYQGTPYSRLNRLFYQDELHYYNGGSSGIDLKGLDEIYAVNDVAWGGGDYYVLVIGYRKDDIMYVQDVFLSKDDKYITRPQVIAKLKEHRPMVTRFEGNNGGHEYADAVRDQLRNNGTRLLIESKDTKSNSNKMARIIRNSPEIKEFRYRNDAERGAMYDLFMDQLFTFTTDGKSKNDDVPDALAMLVEMVASGVQKPVVFKRLF